jgi:signal transduction histidine kinase
VLSESSPLEAPARRLADHLPVVVYATALDVFGAFSFVSAGVRRLLGDSSSDWTRGAGLWLSRVHAADRLRAMAAIDRARRDRAPYLVEYRLADRSGCWVWVRDQGRLAAGGPDAARHFEGSWLDVTDLHQAALDRRRALLEASRARRELEQLLTSASHGLRTPARQLVSLTELALRGGSDDALERLAESARLLEKRLAHLAEYAESALAPGGTAWADAQSELEAAVEELRGVVRNSGGVVTWDALPRVRMEPGHLRRVFFELLERALTATDSRPPRVHVWERSEDGVSVISVRDHGPGLDAPEARDVFRFIETADPVEAEAGLAMAICRELVEKAGGRFWIESERGVGSTFSFSLKRGASR